MSTGMVTLEAAPREVEQLMTFKRGVLFRLAHQLQLFADEAAEQAFLGADTAHQAQSVSIALKNMDAQTGGAAAAQPAPAMPMPQMAMPAPQPPPAAPVPQPAMPAQTAAPAMPQGMPPMPAVNPPPAAQMPRAPQPVMQPAMAPPPAFAPATQPGMPPMPGMAQPAPQPAMPSSGPNGAAGMAMPSMPGATSPMVPSAPAAPIPRQPQTASDPNNAGATTSTPAAAPAAPSMPGAQPVGGDLVKQILAKHSELLRAFQASSSKNQEWVEELHDGIQAISHALDVLIKTQLYIAEQTLGCEPAMLVKLVKNENIDVDYYLNAFAEDEDDEGN